MIFELDADRRFADLPGYNFAPHYVEIDGMRMHFVDEGPRDGSTVLLLHGEPSWSYLYRKMIPPLANAGLRVVAPDLLGFGRSDKPTRIDDYSFAVHVDWMRSFVEALDLNDITLFCQDWGSLIGLRVAAEDSARFARVVLGNGGLPTGDEEFPRAFKIWRAFARWSPWFPIGKILQSGTVTELSNAEVSAYDAPYPSSKYKAGARAFPRLVPTEPDNVASDANRKAWAYYESSEKPFLTTFSNRDPITRGGEKPWQERVPGAKNQAHIRIKNAGHFLQEDKPDELVDAIVSFINA